MKKTIFFSGSIVILVAILSGFAAIRQSHPMKLRMHMKDLSQHGLRLIDPSDVAFDDRLKTEFGPAAIDEVDPIKPITVFLENKGNKTLVAYVVQWCLTKPDGTNQYYRQAVLNPEAFTGASLPSEATRQSGRIEPNSSTLLSLMATDGSGIFRVDITAAETEAIKKGQKPDRETLRKRVYQQFQSYSDVTVSIDAAFFDDGTFVGPDTTGFFNQVSAVAKAKRDLLGAVGSQPRSNREARDQIYHDLEQSVTQAPEGLDSNSTPADYYNYFRKLYASEILRMKSIYGEEKALDLAIQPLNRNWVHLKKSED
ncbi:MAG TPA: hypothetical protein VFS76_10840 [Pyrinomonadaceae bacterium]|nr:hypothetical protein [Pyrinomonadaceae bacterium]